MTDGQLGYITNKVTPEKRITARLRRWSLLEVAGELLPGERVCWCCKRRTIKALASGEGVTVTYSREHKSAGFGNLMRCGSVWTCPVCAARITEGRRAELKEAVSRSNFIKVMITITLQHSRDDKLIELLKALKDSWRRLKMGKGWQLIKARYGLEAYVTSSEVTYGEHGWHPHLHALLFSSLEPGEFDVEAFKKALSERYNALLAKHGRWSSEYYGIDVRFGDAGAGEYASKFGLEEELTKSIMKAGKGGASPFQLLDLYSQGETWAGEAFKEYASVFKGARQLVWSKGGRAVLGLGREASDEELAEEEMEPGREVLVTFTAEQWSQVLKRRARGEVLEAARGGDRAVLWEYLINVLGLIPCEANFAGVS